MKLSIIVVTWNNENYIEQCLKSCISGTNIPYEVIVVHNASTDNTGALIKRAIRGHEELFKVIENFENVGLGEGRNIGIRYASGNYITFLDGDDWYAEGAVNLLAELSEDKTTDLYIYGYKRHYSHGHVSSPYNRDILKLGDISSPEKRNKALTFFGVAWNKLYKSSYLKDINAKFDVGYYEDIDWNFKTLTLAKRVKMINHDLIFYRQRSGSILKTTSQEHFDAIKRGWQLIDFLKENPKVSSEYGESIWRYVAGQSLGVVNMQHRLPNNMKGTYLKKASQMLTDLRALNNISPSIRERIAAFGSPLLWYLSMYLRNRVKTTKRFIKTNLQQTKTKGAALTYKIMARIFPINNEKVFYDSFWGKKADCNPLAIFLHLQGTTDLKHIWHLHPSAPCPEGATAAPVRSLKAIYHMATAKYVISNVNLPNYFKRRSGMITLQTHHGTPLKYMGIDIRKKRPKEMNWLRFRDRTSQWTHMISSNEYSSQIWRQCMPYGAQIIETGYPRNDIFFGDNRDLVQSLKKKYNIPNEFKVALYAPTFRDNERGKKVANDNTALYEKMSTALGEDYYLLIREHHLNTNTIGTNQRIIDITQYPNTNNILLIADILITDYSSIMFDYACLKRPIILYTPDSDQYASTRGIYFDINANAPGAVANDLNTLETILSTHSYTSEENQQKLKKFHTHFCIWEDGNASQRAALYLLNMK